VNVEGDPPPTDADGGATVDPVVVSHERSLRRAPLSRGCAWALALAVVLIVLFGAPGAVYLVYGIMDRQAYERELALAREAGGPWTFEELEAWYPTDPAIVKTTHRWLAAMQTIDGDYRARAKNVPLVGEKTLEQAETDDAGRLAGADLASAKELVERYRPTIDAAHEARRSGAIARYPIVFERLFDQDTGYLRQLRELTDLLAIDAEVRQAEGDPNAAVDDVLSMVAAGESLRNEPTFISQVFRFVCLSFAGDAALRLISRSEISDERLAHMQQAFEVVETESGFRRALPVERFMALHTVRGESPVDDPEVEKNASLPFRDAEAAKTLEFYRLAEESTRKDLLGIAEGQRVIDAEAERLNASSIERLRYPSLLEWGPTGFESIVYMTLNAQARADLTATAIACERYRLANGRWPAALDDLSPDYIAEVPPDPFAGRPIRYAVEDKGILLYSVGADRTDDGGVDDEENFGEGDTVVRVSVDRRGKDQP
jgi:hypothetical protein